MDELMGLFGSDPTAAFDPAAFGLDAGVVLCINQATNFLKDDFVKWGWDQKLNRFYPVLPFILAFLVTVLTKQSIVEAIHAALKYGVWATFTWNAMRVSVKGK